MRILLPLFILTLIESLVKSVTSEQYIEYAKNITQLKDDDLKKALNGNSTLVVFLNADYSEECRRTMKGFAIAAARLKKKQLPADMAFIDCKANQQLCEGPLHTYSYPSIKYIVRGMVVDVKLKGRTQKMVVHSVMDYVKKSGKLLDNREKLAGQKKKHDRFFFYVGKQDEDYSVYQKMSAAYPYIDWLHTFDKSDATNTNGIYFYDYKEGTSDMVNGPHSPLIGGRMDTFTFKYMNLLRSLSDYAMDRLFIHNKASLLLFYPDTDEERGVQIPWWHAAVKIMYKIPCAQIPMLPSNAKNEHNLTPLRNWLGVENPLSPAVRIVSKDSSGRWRFYQLRDKITVDNTNKFFEDFKDGKLKEFHRSQRPEQTHGPIKSLVGKNYIKSVATDKYDVVSIIYSNENPVISDRVLKVATIVSKVMGDFDYLKFVKINADTNSDEHMPQKNFPYIRLYKKDDGRVFQEFEGLYSAKELSEWLAGHLGVENPFDKMIDEMRKGRGDK